MNFACLINDHTLSLTWKLTNDRVILGTLLKEILKALPRIVKLSNFFISFTMEIWQKNVDGKFVVLFSYELRFINVVVLADSGFFQKRGGRIWSKSLKMRPQGFQGEK